MMGLMTLTWAWCENTLATILGVVVENAGPIAGHPQAPLSLKRRVACFRVALRDIAALKPFQQEGRLLAERFIQLGTRRNNFTHGAAWQTQEGGFQSMAIAVEMGKYAIKDHRFNESDAISLNVEIAKLQDDTAAFLLKVLALFDR